MHNLLRNRCVLFLIALTSTVIVNGQQSWNCTNTKASIVAGVGTNPKLTAVAGLTQMGVGGEVAFFDAADSSNWDIHITGNKLD